MELVNKLGGMFAFAAFRDAHENNQLSDILLNNNSIHKVEQKGDILVRYYHPIFQIPESKNGRAHLYAPVKRLGNLHIDTLWFNVFVIWLTSLILFLTLYHDTIRKTLKLLETLKLKKRFKA